MIVKFKMNPEKLTMDSGYLQYLSYRGKKQVIRQQENFERDWKRGVKRILKVSPDSTFHISLQ